MEQPRTGMMKAATVQRERNLASSAQGNDLLIQAAMELAGASEPDAGIKVHSACVHGRRYIQTDARRDGVLCDQSEHGSSCVFQNG